MTWKVTLDRAGIGNVLRTGELPNLVNRTAGQIAAAVSLPRDGKDADVTVESYTTDRGAASVVVRHPNAVGLQAKHGILTAAAASVGLTIRRRG